MENRNILQELTGYRLKVEREGKSVIDVPGILCLPGLLAAPRLGIAGMIAAPLLGYNVHLENGSGKPVDIESAVRKAAEKVMDTAGTAARTIREEIDHAWQAVSADDPESEESEEPEAADETPDQADPSGQESAGEAGDPEGDGIPTIHVNPDD